MTGRRMIMATFNNYATLSYRGITTVSNLVTGEIVESLRLTKTAVVDSYTGNGHLTYTLSIVNAGSSEVSGLNLSDDLGSYTFGTGTVTPLSYTSDSLKYYVNGVLQTAPAVTPGPPLMISGITVPGGGSVILLYDAAVNEYAPLACDESIRNTVSLSGGNLSETLQATATVSPDCSANLSISKFLSPDQVPEDGQLTYTFVICNYGTTEATAADAVAVADVFDPALQDITVMLNGSALPAAQYSYMPTTGAFATNAGAITVPGAVCTQEASGVWTTTPGTATLTVSGMI